MVSAVLIEHQYAIENAHRSVVWCVDWHPNGIMFASCSADRSVKIWSLDKNISECSLVCELPVSHNRTVRRVRWSPDGKRLATCSFDSTVIIWVHDGNEFNEVEQLNGHSNEIKSLSWSVSGEYLATCGRDKTVCIWQAMDNDEFEICEILDSHTQDVKDVVWSPVEDVLASCSYDNSIRLYRDESISWTCISHLVGHSDTVWSVDFNGTGNQLASVSADHLLIVWSVDCAGKAWEKIAHIQLSVQLPLYSVSWNKSKDSHLSNIMACVSGENSIHLVTLILNQQYKLAEIATIVNAHESDINCVCFNRKLPNLLLTCSDDASVKLWRINDDAS